MTTPRIIELVVAIAILVAGLWLYRRRVATDTGAGAYGSQGAVILFVIAAIMIAHALGAMDYRPSQSELELMQDRAQ